jgi:hypothetical protein
LRGGCRSDPIPSRHNRLIQPIDHLPISPWYQVPVQIHRNRDRNVPNLFLDVDGALVLLEQQTGEGVAQIMESDFL